jgi:exodeoxyribonuclease VII small subunit
MSAASTPELSFEQAMERLEEIVGSMESDRMPLDEMVTSYEEGMKLLQRCRQRIENARQRIESISLKADGRAELAPFEPGKDEPAAEDKSKTAARRRPAARPETEDVGDEIRLF